MSSRLLNAIIHDVANFTLMGALGLFLVKIDMGLGLTIVGLFLIRSIAKILITVEKAKEDQKMLDELDRIMKNGKND